MPFGMGGKWSRPLSALGKEMKSVESGWIIVTDDMPATPDIGWYDWGRLASGTQQFRLKGGVDGA